MMCRSFATSASKSRSSLCASSTINQFPVNDREEPARAGPRTSELHITHCSARGYSRSAGRCGSVRINLYHREECPMPDMKIFGEHDDRTREQMACCMQYGSVVGGVLCADGHLGYAQPVGGVIAYKDHISVSGVGFDIACGNMAVKLDLPKAAIADRVGPLLNEIAA